MKFKKNKEGRIVVGTDADERKCIYVKELYMLEDVVEKVIS